MSGDGARGAEVRRGLHALRGPGFARGMTRASERSVFWVLLFGAVLLYALYLLHLQADCPALLPRVDWARYTDEGWYSGAAMLHLQTGQWYTPNGFNPAVAMPLWPLLLRGWFWMLHVHGTPGMTGTAGTGISAMVAARLLAVLLFGWSGVLVFALLRPIAGRVLAATGVLLILASPFSYGFDRMAIVEPQVTLLVLLAMWIAQQRSAHHGRTALQPATPAGSRTGRDAMRGGVVGMLLAAAILTKTTAVGMAPAVLWLLWQVDLQKRLAGKQAYAEPEARVAPALKAFFRRGRQEPRALIGPAVAAGIVLLVLACYFFALVRSHHLPDYQHLFWVNRGHANGHRLFKALAHAVIAGGWMGAMVYALTLLLLGAAVFRFRELWRVPLFSSAVLGLLCPIALIGWHTWFLPHYYLPCVPPMVMVLVLCVHVLARRAHRSGASQRLRLAHMVAMLLMEVAFAVMLIETVSEAVHPSYTYVGAAEDVARRMRAQAAATGSSREPKLLASSAGDMAMFSGIVSVNPEWPIGGLPALLQQEQPGWYGAYLPWDEMRIPVMRRRLPFEEVARYRIEPDADHQFFVLYRVQPPDQHARSRAATDGFVESRLDAGKLTAGSLAAGASLPVQEGR